MIKNLRFIAFILTCKFLSAYQLPENFRSLVAEYTFTDSFSLQNYKLVKVPKSGFFYIDREIYDGKKHDAIKTWLAKGKEWEANISKRITQYIRKGSVVLDIGSHVGTHTLNMCRLVGEHGLVIAFEPQRKLFFELTNNINVNRFNNCLCLPFAVGANEGMAYVRSAQGNEGGGGISSYGDECPVIAVDSLNLTNVSFMKIDVEGYEDNAIEGARNTILKNKPIMIIEIMGGVDASKNPPRELLERRNATIKKIQSLGYHVNQISVHDFLATPI